MSGLGINIKEFRRTNTLKCQRSPERTYDRVGWKTLFIPSLVVDVTCVLVGVESYSLVCLSLNDPSLILGNKH